MEEKKIPPEEHPELELEDLIPQVRHKAEEILKELMQKGDLSKEKAIRKAIARAEEWWMNMEG